MLLMLKVVLLHRGQGRKQLQLSLSEAQSLCLFSALKEFSFHHQLQYMWAIFFLQMFHEKRDRETKDTVSSKIFLASGEAAHL